MNSSDSLNNLLNACKDDFGIVSATLHYGAVGDYHQFVQRDLFILNTLSREIPSIKHHPDVLSGLQQLLVSMNTLEGMQAMIGIVVKEMYAGSVVDSLQASFQKRAALYSDQWIHKFGNHQIGPDDYADSRISPNRPLPI